MSEIAIADTSPGMSYEDQRLFLKPHCGGVVRATASGRGRTLELATAQGIIESHGGRMWVESKGYNESQCPGVRFYILLPIMMPREKLPLSLD